MSVRERVPKPVKPQKEGRVTSPADTEDTNPKHRFTDKLGRSWHRHLNGALYCDGTRVLQRLDSRTVQVTATDSLMIETAGALHREWN